MLKTLVSTPILLNSRKSLLVLPQTYNQLVVFKYGKDKNLSSTLQKASHCQQSSWNAISFLESGNREKVHFPNRKAYQGQVLSWKVHWSQLSTTEMGIGFLNAYFRTGIGYSSVNSACSAYSNILKPVCNIQFGKSPLVCKLLKGVFKDSLAKICYN